MSDERSKILEEWIKGLFETIVSDGGWQNALMDEVTAILFRLLKTFSVRYRWRTQALPLP
ncbi:MAG: hypothetical protein JNK31_06585 [Candidatus Competibacter sp.]|nr:hypothetical protein [Candidatus Competibacter sp.]